MIARNYREIFFLLFFLIAALLPVACDKQPQPMENTPETASTSAPECPIIESAPAFSKTTDEPLLLRYRFQKGERYNVLLQIDSQVEIETHGQRMKTWMPIRTAMQYKILDVASANVSDLALLYKHVVIDLTYEGGNDQGVYTFDSAVDLDETNPTFKPFLSLIDTPIVIKMNNLGQIMNLDLTLLLKALGIKETDKSNRELQEIMQRNQETFFEIFPALPEAAVKPGDSFPTRGYSTKLPTASQLDFTADYLVKAISADRRSVLLEPVGKLFFSLMPGAPKSQVGDNVFNGWLIFNAEKGYVEKSAYSVCIKFYIGDGNEQETIRLNLKVACQTEVVPGPDAAN